MTPESEDTCLSCAASLIQKQRNEEEDIPQLCPQRTHEANEEKAKLKTDEPQIVQCNREKGIPEPATAKEKKSSHGTTSSKQRELRQLETKLKKWEEELRLREAKTTDFENDKRRLEDYLNKTEARNLELEKTVRTLQKRINLLEVSANDKDGYSSTNMDQEPTQQSVVVRASLDTPIIALQDHYPEGKVVTDIWNTQSS